MAYLLITEVSKKQEYIFKSNKLTENIGASKIIEYITEELPSKFISQDKSVYEGGGKSLYKFNDKAYRKDPKFKL